MIKHVVDPKALGFEISEFGRPVVYLAESIWFGGKASNSCLFSRRDAAVAWAKDQIYGKKFEPDSPAAGDGRYPNEWHRDDPGKTPTFIQKWFDAGGGQVTVTRCEVEVG